MVYLATWEENSNARGVSAAAAYERGSYLLSESLHRGSEGPLNQRSRQPFKGSLRPTYHTPRAAGSKQHSWSSLLAGCYAIP